MEHKDRLLLKGSDVADELGISRALAYRWMQNGTLPVLRVAGARSIRVPRQALLDWVKENTATPTDGGQAA